MAAMNVDLTEHLLLEDLELRCGRINPREIHKCVKGFSGVKGGGDNDVNMVEAFILAAEYGCNKCVKMFIKAGADVNKTDSDNNTALVVAAIFGHVKTVNLLLKEGADVNLPGKYGRTALAHIARTAGRRFVGLENHSGGGKYKECVKALTRKMDEGDVNKSVDGRETPLMSVAMFGDETILKTFIQKGGDVNARDKDGLTALVLAIDGYAYKSIEILLKAGADVNVPSCERGETALFEAVTRPAVDVRYVEMIINAGADVNITDCDDISVLTVLADSMIDEAMMDARALPRGHRCMQLLLQAGCIVNKTNIKGRNALQCFIDSPQRYNVSLLILLLVAGEQVAPEVERGILSEFEEGVTLRNSCRKVIRKHMMKVRPHENLFVRIETLEIPSELKSYLLYGVSLNDRYVWCDDDSDYVFSSDDENTSNDEDDWSTVSDDDNEEFH